LDGPVVQLEAEVVTESASCPSCGTVSFKVHDRYVRRPVDLPWRGRTVRLVLTVRRFRCVNPRCERATFAEDCGSGLPRYARRTLEVSNHLFKLAEVAGGEAGARIAASEGLPINPDTLLRLLRRSPLSEVRAPRVLGVDDFSLRRRHTYGTIFLDLESGRPIDMLEGREADTLANWLRAHPGVEVMARDRSGAYAEGCRVGAPRAIQVADRFHLVQNASAALDGMLRGRRLWVDGVEPASEVSVSESAVQEGGQERPTELGPTKQYLAQRRAARVARWEQVRALAEVGTGIRRIAREVGISRETVRRLMTTTEAPHNQVVRPRPGGLKSPTLQPYVPYLQDRWQAGCTNVAQLYREIAAEGYRGSRSLLSQALQSWRPTPLPSEPRGRASKMTKRLSMRWICLRPPEQLNPSEKILLDKLLDRDTELALGYDLLQQFRRMVKERDVGTLDQWLDRAKASNLPTFVGLANGIQADREAVVAGLTLPWSNGLAEGHINRLKLIKRQGYGRAKFDLLRARVLAA
jgi:transposase